MSLSTKIKLLVISVVLCSSTIATAQTAGPFGFERGMSKQDVIKLVGRENIDETKGDVIWLKTAPRPNPHFDLFGVVISEKLGLVKVMVLGKPIETATTGTDIRSEYDDVVRGVSNNYGHPSNDWDFVTAGSIWNKPADFTMGLLKKERVLASAWTKLEVPNHVKTIMVETKGLGLNKAFISLSYELDTYAQYSAEVKSKQDTSY